MQLIINYIIRHQRKKITNTLNKIFIDISWRLNQKLFGKMPRTKKPRGVKYRIKVTRKWNSSDPIELKLFRWND
ncbi:unnamed protein product [Rhizophagus irregularis]|uniref:Uncharacterized protein n=1 Tax=Rhizophagus irregularis TaxID=588596 RepID=A0A916A0I6_9GLOM|nr:unnamed protein product [Rhizophagus irregularis]